MKNKRRAINAHHAASGGGVVPPPHRARLQMLARVSTVLAFALFVPAVFTTALTAKVALTVLGLGGAANALSFRIRARVKTQADPSDEDVWRRNVARKASSLQFVMAVSIVISGLMVADALPQLFNGDAAGIALFVAALAGLFFFLGAVVAVNQRPKLFLSNFVNGIGSIGAILMVGCGLGTALLLIAPGASAFVLTLVAIFVLSNFVIMARRSRDDTYLSPVQRRVVEANTARSLLAALAEAEPTLSDEIAALKILRSLSATPEVERIVAARLAAKYRRSGYLATLATGLLTAAAGVLSWTFHGSAEALLELLVQTHVAEWLCHKGLGWFCKQAG